MVKFFEKGGMFLTLIVLFLLAIVFFRITGNVTYLPTTVDNSTVYCQVLNNSGVYILNQSATGANYSASPCFNITASDVVLDCASYSLENLTASGSAVYAAYVSNITVKNCGIRLSNSGVAITFKGVNNSFITNNNLTSNNKGVYAEDSNNLEINGNRFVSNSEGLVLNNSADNTLANNTFTSNELAVLLTKSSENTLSNNNMLGCSSSNGCLILEGSSANTLSLGNISSSNTALQIKGLDGLNSSNNLFKDAFITGSLDVNVSSAGSTNNSFTNATYDASEESVADGGEVIRRWHYRVFVNSTTNSSGINGVNITIFNSSSSIVVSALTGSNGYINSQNLLSYQNNGSRNHLGSYTILASNGSSSANHSINLTSNLLNDYLSFNITAASNSSNSTDDEEETEEETPAEEPATETPAEEESVVSSESSADDTSVQSTVAPIIYLEQSQIEGGYTAELDAGGSIYFNVSGEFYNLNVDNLEKNAENSIVTVTVSSEPQTFSLKIGEQKKLDLNTDEYYDVLIGFDNLSFEEKALISIMKINEAIVKEQPIVEEQVTSTTDDNSVTFSFIGSIEQKVNSPIIGPVTALHIIIGVFILCIVMFIYIYSHSGKNKASVKK